MKIALPYIPVMRKKRNKETPESLAFHIGNFILQKISKTRIKEDNFNEYRFILSFEAKKILNGVDIKGLVIKKDYAFDPESMKVGGTD